MRFDLSIQIPWTPVVQAILLDELNQDELEPGAVAGLQDAIARVLLSRWEDQLLDLGELLQSDQHLRREVIKVWSARRDRIPAPAAND